MILSFSAPQFEQKIKDRIKIHTIREDKNERWGTGSVIHFWQHNPRNPSKNPYCFGEGTVSHVRRIFIEPQKNIVSIEGDAFTDIKRLNSLAVNDGFNDWEHMKTWFTKPFNGKLIYWDYDSCKFLNQ